MSIDKNYSQNDKLMMIILIIIMYLFLMFALSNQFQIYFWRCILSLSLVINQVLVCFEKSMSFTHDKQFIASNEVKCFNLM